MTSGTWPMVRDIYTAGIEAGDATFESQPPAWPQWDADHLDGHRFIAVDDPLEVVGWVAVAGVSERCVYGGVVESSVYVHPRQQGRGVGRALMDALVASTESAGIWTIQTGIFPENTASLRLHHAVGFRTVGIRERLGQQQGRWRDVVLLERRSRVV